MRFLLLFIIVPIFAFSQSNFLIQDNQVVWQKIFEMKSTPETYKNHLLQNLEFSDIELMDDKIIAIINNLKIDYKGYGKSAFSTSIYIPQSNFNALSIIEFKDNKYRVTIKDIVTIVNNSDVLSEQGETEKLETYALNRNGFRNRFINKDAPIFEYTFNKLFEPKQESDNDW